ncbi:hypothetical protein D3C83_302860 [compost metagenome]
MPQRVRRERRIAGQFFKRGGGGGILPAMDQRDGVAELLVHRRILSEERGNVRQFAAPMLRRAPDY